MRSSPLALAAILLLAPVPALSNTILVPANQPTIQAGLNAAVNGDTVLVAPGTYTGPSNRNLDFAGKGVVLRSSAGPATTIIDCQNTARGARFQTNETPLSVIDGFTIRNGSAPGDVGGGIFFDDADPTIKNCIFTANQAVNGGMAYMIGASPRFNACQFNGVSAVNWGGVVYAEGQCNPIFTNCTFSQCSAPFGGAMFFNTGSSPSLIGCTFTGNSALTYGGAILIHGSTASLDRCQFSGNTAKRGGAIYCEENAGAAVDSCTFSQNTAIEQGGGICCIDIASLNLTHCTFTGNRTTGTETFQINGGGGFFADHPTNFVMEDCTFTGNTCDGESSRGGGCFFTGSFVPIDVLRCTFAGNSAGLGGGCWMQPKVRLVDCTLTDNSSIGDGGAVARSYGALRCTFARNHSGRFGGALFAISDAFPIEDCTFTDNTAGRGGAIWRDGGLTGTTQILRSTFDGNSAGTGGALFLASSGGAITLTDLTAFDNTAGEGGFLYNDRALSLITISECTIANNSAPVGSGMIFKGPAIISRTIIAFGAQGEAISCAGAGKPALSCADVFGNAGGDWTGCISDQLGINGNFSLNPLFCNVGARDFTLAQASPCAPAHSPAGCNLIGSQPVACASPIGIADATAPPATTTLRIIPNPLRTAGIIEWTGAAGGVEALRLYNATGRLVLRHDLRGTQTTRGHLSWSDFLSGRRLAPGVYFLRTLGPLGVKVADENVVVLP